MGTMGTVPLGRLTLVFKKMMNWNEHDIRNSNSLIY